MREIKFKAWHKIEKRLFDVYGFDKDNVYEESMNDYLATVVSRKYCDLIQCTGLQDVNGKDIYEGYIILIDSNKCLCPVEYSENDCRFLLRNGRGYRGYFALIGDLKIVGNIYENPELLEQGRGKNND